MLELAKCNAQGCKRPSELPIGRARAAWCAGARPGRSLAPHKCQGCPEPCSLAHCRRGAHPHSQLPSCMCCLIASLWRHPRWHPCSIGLQEDGSGCHPLHCPPFTARSDSKPLKRCVSRHGRLCSSGMHTAAMPAAAASGAAAAAAAAPSACPASGVAAAASGCSTVAAAPRPCHYALDRCAGAVGGAGGAAATPGSQPVPRGCQRRGHAALVSAAAFSELDPGGASSVCCSIVVCPQLTSRLDVSA